VLLRRGRGLDYSAATGNRKELRHSDMMDGDGKMGERNVRESSAGRMETCWSHLIHMRTVAARGLNLLCPLVRL
jgi:hypothetical protein